MILSLVLESELRQALILIEILVLLPKVDAA